MGKRILTDISDVWESDNEGVVTDVVKTRKGVRIFTTVTEPAKIGDKVAGNHGNKCIISQILPKEQMPLGEDGKPLDILWSPLGLVSRTNASQIHETLLGKIAAKTGKIEVMPAFYEGDIYEYVSNKLKQNHLKDTEDLTDPETGKKIPGVLTGITHVYKLKHIADTKMSARGTDEYTAEGVPGGSGMTGCFPAAQTLMTLQGPQSIAKICSKRMPEYVMTFDGTQWCYRRVTDWFTYKEQIENILHINTESAPGAKVVSIYPTKNHIMYMSDMSTKLAGELKEGDTLAGHAEDGVVPIRIKAIKPYVHDKPGITEIPVYDITVDETHKYTLAGGILCSNSKRYGVLEQGAMVGHGAFHNIVDAKLLRGQSNADFWRSIRTGDIPVIPGEPLVHKKFFAHLQGSGVNINKTAQGITAFALSNQGVKDLAGARELKSKDTYEAKNFRRLDGGLFGQDVFGINGDKWGYIQLDEPLPNPAMEEPLALILNIPLKKFAAVASGKEEVDGMKSAADIKRRLEEINLPLETRRAKEAFKNASMSNKDKMLKRYVALDRMKRNGTHPADFMLDRIPVLPPIYRPISSHSGLTMVSDSNYLYAQMMDARDDFREAKALPEEYQTQARENLYNSWKELVGLHEPRDVKLKNKHVKGLLKWALGDSPKYSAFHRKVLGASVDTVGRGVVVPNPRLKLNQVGIPINMAFGIMAPFITREMVKRGYTPVDAMKAVKNQTRQATDILKDVIKTHPVQMNRAPTLHKLGIMAFDPVLTTGSAIHVHPSIVTPFNMDFDGDMATIHVPVSDAARKEARAKMYPERNLIAMKDRKIAYKPEKEYMQGLYIATRLNPKGDVRPRTFETLADARQAARDGLLEIDEPVNILDRKLKK
jgi:hypothetical protein